MAGVSIAIIQLKTEGFNIKSLDKDLHSMIQKTRSDVQNTLRKYPGPAASGSSYVRTGELSRHWGANIQETHDETILEVHNSQRYAIYVYGDESGDGQQDQFIETGWPTLIDVLDEADEKLARDIESRLEQI